MALSRILIIRHGEEHAEAGVDERNKPDEHSLTIRGWQRAGALVRFFHPRDGRSDLTPDTIHASKIASGSETKRPQQTVAPLAASLDVAVRAEHAKGDEGTLMADVLREEGTVLVAWEHSRIPDLVDALPDPPAGVPGEWPKAHYDLVWAFTREGKGWRFDVIEQDVLSEAG